MTNIAEMLKSLNCNTWNRFYINTDTNTVTWLNYEPWTDGGRLSKHIISMEAIRKAVHQVSISSFTFDFWTSLQLYSDQKYNVTATIPNVDCFTDAEKRIQKNNQLFQAAAAEFLKTPDFMNTFKNSEDKLIQMASAQSV